MTLKFRGDVWSEGVDNTGGEGKNEGDEPDPDILVWSLAGKDEIDLHQIGHDKLVFAPYLGHGLYRLSTMAGFWVDLLLIGVFRLSVGCRIAMVDGHLLLVWLLDINTGCADVDIVLIGRIVGS